MAHTTSGAAAADTVVTVPVQINDEMNLKLRALFASVASFGKSNLALNQEDFQVLDNGAPQQIVTFGRDELPLTAVLLLDTSESMQGERLEAVRRGTRAFLDGMKPSDEAMLALFSDRLLQLHPVHLRQEGARLGDRHHPGGRRARRSTTSSTSP